MEAHLDTFIHDDEVNLKIRSAAATGKTKLMEYYSVAKACHMNIFATACHPHLRLGWFLNLGDDAYKSALALFEHVFKEYSEQQGQSDSAFPQPAPAPIPPSNNPLALLARRPKNPHPVQVAPPQPEIERWISEEGGLGDPYKPLQWWKVHAEDFPTVSRMARDFLAIPATSVSVERLFSRSRHVCRDTRSSFKAQTITEIMCAKKWLEDPRLYAEVIRKVQ